MQIIKFFQILQTHSKYQSYTQMFSKGIDYYNTIKILILVLSSIMSNFIVLERSTFFFKVSTWARYYILPALPHLILRMML